MRRWLYLAILLGSVLAGCGDTTDSSVVVPPPGSSPVASPFSSPLPGASPSASVGASPIASPTPIVLPSPGMVTVNFVLETLQRAVPAYVQTYRVRGVDSAGRLAYGPFERPRTAKLVLTDVPLNVREIQIDLVLQTTVTGLVRLPVDLVTNPNPVFNDPNFVDVSSLQTLAVTPPNVTVARSSQTPLAARGTFADGQSYDLTGSVRWTSVNPAVATVSSSGVLQFVAPGNTTVTASSGTVVGQTNVTVSPARLVSLSVTPANSTLAIGATQAFTARGTFSDNTTQDLTSQVSWASSAPSVASVSTTGLATALSGGVTTITAASGNITGTATLSVSGPALLRLDVLPANFVLSVFSSRQLQAQARYADGSSQDVTGLVTWRNSEPLRAAVGPTGLVTALFAGDCTINATLGSVTGTANCTVTDSGGGGGGVVVGYPATFTASSLATGGTPQRMTTGDFNTDGRLDIAYTNFAGANNQVVVLLGDGAGSFAVQPAVVAGNGVFGIAAGFLNAGSALDLVVADGGDNNVTVLLGNGVGGFPGVTNYTTGGLGPGGLTLGDFDGDSDLDVAVANDLSDNVSSLLNNGAGVLAAAGGSPFSTGAGGGPQGVVAALLDPGALLDLVVTNGSVNNFARLFGLGAGAFGAPAFNATGTNPIEPLAGDLNADGRTDVVTANLVSNSLSIFLGDGAGGFGAPASIAVGTSPTGIASSDFNGDGRVDLACNNGGSNNVSVLIGNGAGAFALTANLATGGGPRCLVTGDFNNDGRADIVAGNTAGITIFLHN